jgi:hypothetical protein
MIKEALQYIVGLSAPQIEEIGGETWSDKQLHRVDYCPMAEPIQLSTLESLVDYIKANVDNMGANIDECMFIHVVSPTKVKMYSCLDRNRNREYIAEVTANVPEFGFNRWIDHESFCIALQSKFLPNEDRALLLKFAGTVESGTIAEYGDDGVTQKATVKVGIAKKGEAVIPNPVELVAYRSFVEVEQPVSQYIFRMQDRNGIQCALYEADGGAWKIEAMHRIKEYLESALEGQNGYIVIS